MHAKAIGRKRLEFTSALAHLGNRGGRERLRREIRNDFCHSWVGRGQARIASWRSRQSLSEVFDRYSRAHRQTSDLLANIRTRKPHSEKLRDLSPSLASTRLEQLRRVFSVQVHASCRGASVRPTFPQRRAWKARCDEARAHRAAIQLHLVKSRRRASGENTAHSEVRGRIAIAPSQSLRTSPGGVGRLLKRRFGKFGAPDWR